ncbi:ADP-ribosylation factor-like protein 16 isoform X2 [Apostichopus japonicus]|uniref:ADP-ribosylation factor-like protein 16 isoform X2 n=1 Tax=Stichopus japonicus TaxID=307972 RepID=UPI003AB27746
MQVKWICHSSLSLLSLKFVDKLIEVTKGLQTSYFWQNVPSHRCNWYWSPFIVTPKLAGNEISSDGTVTFTDVPATIPTVGTNLSNLTVEKKREVTVRELGGAMAPIWPTYLNDTNVILFMVDASSPSQISASTILLLTTLASDQLQSASVLVLLNKIDMSSSLSVSELMYLMQLEDLVLTASQSITVIQCSAKDGRGLKEVMTWISENSKGNSTDT